MKRIIKRGKVPNPIKRFKCSKCGCVFEADPDDYEKGFAYQEGEGYFYSNCPECGRTSYAVKGEDNGE